MLSDSAFALSCMRPDLIKTLEEAKASEKVYHILVGKFVSDPSAYKYNGGLQAGLPRIDGTREVGVPLTNKSPRITQALFEGVSLSNDPRNDEQLSHFPVDIKMSCTSIWCGTPPASDQDVVAFVEARDEQVPILRISACPKWLFAGNSETHIKTIRHCLDNNCSDDSLKRLDVPVYIRP